ncbi:hypothetical protein CP972_11800 [Streptomyces prasinus]|uniref:Uncharacterized protein n=1 Tax=Streptomyces prasinus TaxID=67345 RepID=A0ABX6AUY9_9ACTN|nr:hypothetical protein CP972_11800 [Streptomyces prasinus]
MGIFVFRHGSRLLEDAVAALTSRNIPRSKASGYAHMRVARLRPLRRRRFESQDLASRSGRVCSLLERTASESGSPFAHVSGNRHV